MSAHFCRLLAALCLFSLPVAVPAGDAFSVYESANDFDTVIAGAKLAIQERGMYINNLMHIDEMLERTGKDLRLGGKVYERAWSIEFCSAVLSRRMAAEDPGRIVYCPFTLAVYVLPGQPDKTYVAHRAVPEDEIRASETMAEVAAMLKAIAEEAVSW